jgi:glucosyl-dolichyl phosphate glucuronosyltransferase
MISVIICTYDRSESLRGTFDSLQKMRGVDDIPWETVVVDNNCHDKTAEIVKEYQRRSTFPLRYVRETQQGLSYARNRGIAAARGDVLAFIDDDVTVDADWLAHLRTAYDRFDCIGVGGRIVPVWTAARPSWLKEDGPYAVMQAIVSFDHGKQPHRLNTPPFGANMSFRRSAFADYGLFRTDLGRRGAELFGGEDTEFGRRLLRHGESLVYDPAVIVYHSVADERLTVAYFRRWYFYYGRTSVRLARAEPGPTPIHLPRRLLRALAATVWQYLCSGDRQRRFHSMLHVCLVLGRIREALVGVTARRKRNVEPPWPSSTSQAPCSSP